MSNQFSLLILLLLFVSSTSAQSLLKGKVSDQEGNPLVGVNVFLHQNKTGTVSEEDGTYQLLYPRTLKCLRWNTPI
jgi:hypothetical protein